MYTRYIYSFLEVESAPIFRWLMQFFPYICFCCRNWKLTQDTLINNLVCTPMDAQSYFPSNWDCVLLSCTEWSFYLWTHELTSHPSHYMQCLRACFDILFIIFNIFCDNVSGVKQQSLLLLNSMSPCLIQEVV
jgi:hypothetical protein